ncbi:MAG: ArsR/SmtB family transcription factor [Bacteroidales bacterium]
MTPRPENIEVFRAIASSTRRDLLDKLSNREQTVQRLAASLEISVPAVSQQLTILRKAGLVTVRRAGRWRVYRLNAQPLRQVIAWAQAYERFWVATRLHALDEELRRISPPESRWR